MWNSLRPTLWCKFCRFNHEFPSQITNCAWMYETGNVSVMGEILFLRAIFFFLRVRSIVVIRRKWVRSNTPSELEISVKKSLAPKESERGDYSNWIQWRTNFEVNSSESRLVRWSSCSWEGREYLYAQSCNEVCSSLATFTTLGRGRWIEPAKLWSENAVPGRKEKEPRARSGRH